MLAEVSEGQDKFISTIVLYDCKEEGSFSFPEAAGSNHEKNGQSALLMGCVEIL